MNNPADQVAMLTLINDHYSTNSGPPSVNRLFGVQFISALFLSPSYTVGQVPLAYLAYPWTVTYTHIYIQCDVVHA